MGTTLGREGTIQQRSRSFDEKQLGDLGINLDSITSGGSNGDGINVVSAINAGSSLVAPVGRFFKGIFSGGSRCTSQINQQKQELETLIRNTLSQSDMRNLVSGTESNVSPRPAAMAEFFFGGRDCLHKNVSPGDQRFLDRLPVVLQEKAQAAQNTQPATTAQVTTLSAGFGQALSSPVVIGAGLLGIGGLILLFRDNQS